MSEAAAIFFVRPDIPRKSDLATLVADLDNTASNAHGFIATNLAVFQHETLDWAVVITFRSRELLSEFLESEEQEQFLSALKQHKLDFDEDPLIVEEGIKPPDGVAIITHQVKKHQVESFIDMEADSLIRAAEKLPGFQGAALIPSGVDREVWLTILRYETADQLNAWLASPERAKQLPRLRALLEEDFSTARGRSPFGAVVRLVGGAPQSSPAWKMVMLLVSVLFPTVIIMLRYLNPVLTDLHLQPGIIALVGQLIATALVTKLWMPPMSKAFLWWIDPIDGRDTATSIKGAVAVVAIYAVEVGFFWVFPGLTPWGA
jgi:uncharacterized protein